MNKLDEILSKYSENFKLALEAGRQDMSTIKGSDTKKAMIEFARHILEEAAENAEIEQKKYFEATPEECLSGIEIWDDNGSDRPSFVAFVNKQSITDTLNKYL